MNLKISLRLGLMLALVAVIIIANFFTISYHLNSQKDDAAVIDAARRNLMLSQRIAFYSSLAVKGRPVKEELKSMTELLGVSLDALKVGGIAPGIAGNRVLRPTSEGAMPVFLECERAWVTYRQNVETIVGESISLTAGTITDSLQTADVEPANPDVMRAQQYIEENAGAMLTKFNDLVTLYVQEAETRQTRLAWLTGIFAGCSLIALVAGFWILQRFIVAPIRMLGSASANLSEGDVSGDLSYKTGDELGIAINGFQKLIINIRNAAGFAHEIAKGNFDSAFAPASDKDDLGKALIDMRARLQEVAIRDKKRNWGTEGLARFSEILRAGQNDLKTMSSNVLSELVRYMEANQGGLFIVNDDEEQSYLELLAMYAWSKKKFLSKRIEQGEGLIGQAWLEKEIIYMRVVPHDYISITSGLGAANPRSIIIVPLKLEQEVFGILELASFREYEEHEREFLSKLSETLASTLSAAKVNQRTKRLLEQSQQQAEELRAQEEEMRQNMEELQATQEEMRRKSTETESRLQAIDESGIASIEFNLDGTIVVANPNFLQLMEYSLSEIVGRHHRIFVSPEYAVSAEYKQFWMDLSSGIPRPGRYQRVTKSGRNIVIQGSYSIIRDGEGKPYRILKLANDVTELVSAHNGVNSRATSRVPM